MESWSVSEILLKLHTTETIYHCLISFFIFIFSFNFFAILCCIASAAKLAAVFCNLHMQSSQTRMQSRMQLTFQLMPLWQINFIIIPTVRKSWQTFYKCISYTILPVVSTFSASIPLPDKLLNLFTHLQYNSYNNTNNNHCFTVIIHANLS